MWSEAADCETVIEKAWRKDVSNMAMTAVMRKLAIFSELLGLGGILGMYIVS